MEAGGKCRERLETLGPSFALGGNPRALRDANAHPEHTLLAGKLASHSMGRMDHHRLKSGDQRARPSVWSQAILKRRYRSLVCLPLTHDHNHKKGVSLSEQSNGRLGGFGADQAPNSAILDNFELTRRGLVLPDLFAQILEENSVFLPRKTARALLEQFQAPNGGIQATKFLKWVELSRPADHVDPELVFARLPQPYRRIVKILEKDILDASWELIKQQSARFKAEAAAALAATARSTRSSALNNSSLDQAAGDPDDYEAAKKRCCKRFERKAVGDSLTAVACISQHPSFPMTLVALEDNAGGDDELQRSRILLQLFNTTTQEMIAEHTLPLAQAGDLPTNPSSGPRTRYEVAHLTSIRVRSAIQEGCASTATCAFGVQLTESTATPANGDQTESTTRVTSVNMYRFNGVNILDQSGGAISADQPLSFQLVATGKFESLDWMELSPDGQYLALSTAPGSIAIHKIPSEAAMDLVSSTESRAVLDLNTSPGFMKIENDVTSPGSNSSVARAHFVVKPSLAPPRSSRNCCFHLVEAYAIVVCHDAKVLKYILRSSSTSGTPATPRASWNHLAAITASAVDSTTQYLVVGLANGSIVIWDTLEEIDHVYLAPSAADTVPSSLSAKNNLSIDVVLVYRDEYVVAFSAASQQVRFFDIKNRVTPQLLRVVSAPAASAQQKKGVELVTLVETTSILDVPIAMVGYSNGSLMLYDLRTAEAMGSIRYRSSMISNSKHPSHSQSILASQHGISVAQALSLDFYDWHQLLLASFPSFNHILQQRNLAQDSVNSKRLFLSSLATPLIAPLPSLSEFANDSIDRMLRRTAGLPTTSSPTRTAAVSSNTLADQRQHSKTGFGALASSDPSASIGQQQSRLAPALSSSDEPAEQLPFLPEIALQPSKQSLDVRFGQYYQDLGAAITKEKETKMHRRRKELIKALTAESW